MLHIHAIASILMTGIIWIIQCVHYPSFRFIASSDTASFHQMHTERIGLVVAPLMIIELITAVFLVFHGVKGGVLAFVLTILIWLSTFFVQVPIHKELGTTWHIDQVERLIKTNWMRTVLWTIKSAGVLWWIYAAV